MSARCLKPIGKAPVFLPVVIFFSFLEDCSAAGNCGCLLQNFSLRFHAHCTLVSPFSYLFFSDWGSSPRIVRTRLDGSERIDFVSPVATSDPDPSGRTGDLWLKNQSIKAPYGLAIDYEENMLYWCDNKLNLIERVNISSMERKVIISTNLTDCQSVDVHGDYVYWADS